MRGEGGEPTPATPCRGGGGGGGGGVGERGDKRGGVTTPLSAFQAEERKGWGLTRQAERKKATRRPEKKGKKKKKKKEERNTEVVGISIRAQLSFCSHASPSLFFVFSPRSLTARIFSLVRPGGNCR